MPSDALERLSGFDAIFLEAEGDPSVPDDGTVWELVLAIRRHFRQYVNVGPVRRFDGVRTPLRDELTQNMDFAVVGENGEGGVLKRGRNDQP